MESPIGRGGRIHVAGVIDRAEARLLIDCGVRHLGLPLALAHHRQDLDVAEAAAIVRQLGGSADFFLITYLGEAAAVAALCRRLDVSTVQLHGPIEVSELARLRDASTPLVLIKSLIVRGDDFAELAAELERLAPWVDAFITDTFDPSTGACGATGRVHDWRISRRLAERSPRPLILAGGLDPDNVARAIRAVRPAGVDVHTGVEGRDGRKRRDRVERFVAAAREAFRVVSPR